MSIERENLDYAPCCDICGSYLPAEMNFEDAVEAKKAAGWRAKKDAHGWADYCPDCWESAHGATADFGGVGL